MLKLGEAAQKVAFHLRQRRTNAFFLYAKRQKLMFHCLAQRAEVTSADRAADRNKDGGAGLDQHSCIHGD